MGRGFLFWTLTAGAIGGLFLLFIATGHDYDPRRHDPPVYNGTFPTADPCTRYGSTDDWNWYVYALGLYIAPLAFAAVVFFALTFLHRANKEAAIEEKIDAAGGHRVHKSSFRQHVVEDGVNKFYYRGRHIAVLFLAGSAFLYWVALLVGFVALSATDVSRCQGHANHYTSLWLAGWLGQFLFSSYMVFSMFRSSRGFFIRNAHNPSAARKHKVSGNNSAKGPSGDRVHAVNSNREEYDEHTGTKKKRGGYKWQRVPTEERDVRNTRSNQG